MASAKTLALLAVAHTYEVRDRKVLVLKPATDTRFGKTTVASRAGLCREASLTLNADTVILPDMVNGSACVLVDEAQFLSTFVVDQLRDVATNQNIPVLCYGLRTDFRSKLFEGSKRLLEVADTIEEIKTTCTYCTKKSVFNLKAVDGVPTVNGDQVTVGAEELYVPTCPTHFYAKLQMTSTALSACYEGRVVSDSTPTNES